ncbi:hypothetical protein D3C78_1412510 [compost metagenome]
MGKAGNGVHHHPARLKRRAIHQVQDPSFEIRHVEIGQRRVEAIHHHPRHRLDAVIVAHRVDHAFVIDAQQLLRRAEYRAQELHQPQ